MLQLADLDRLHLIANLDRLRLIELAAKYTPPHVFSDILGELLSVARANEKSSRAAWEKARATAIADARAVKARIEAKGFDAVTTNLMALSKASTRKSCESWSAYQKAFKHCVEIERQFARACA